MRTVGGDRHHTLYPRATMFSGTCRDINQTAFASGFPALDAFRLVQVITVLASLIGQLLFASEEHTRTITRSTSKDRITPVRVHRRWCGTFRVLDTFFGDAFLT